MYRILCILLLSLAGAECLQAQGFQSVNGRNHPWIHWKVSETEHFRIIYPDHLQEIDDQAASIAEETYRALSRNLSVEFDEKIRLYLSDTDEINNGFASPVGNGTIHVWVNVHNYADTWTGREKWLRKVIAHEVAHVFHFEATRTRLGLLNYVVGDPTPSFWTEGLAQYQTERWDSQRGDRWLRTSVFDGRPGYRDGSSLHNRRLMYASGSSQVRYFAQTYGDSTLSDMLKKRGSVLGGMQYHDFSRAFREVAGKSYPDFYEEWKRHVNVYYHTLASGMSRVDSLDAERWSLPGQYYFDVKVSPRQDRVAILALPSLSRPVRELSVIPNDSTGSVEKVVTGSIRSDLAWNPEGDQLIYSRRVRGRKSKLENDIFLLDLPSGRERQVTFGRRASWPAFSPDGDEIAYVVNEGGTGNIQILHLETGREHSVTQYSGDIQLIHLVWNRIRNELVFHRFDPAGNRELVVMDLDNRTERVIDAGEFDNRSPVVSPDGDRLAYISLRDHVPNVFVADLESGYVRRATDLFTGAEVYDWLPSTGEGEEERLLVKAAETKRREALYRMNAEPFRTVEKPSETGGDAAVEQVDAAGGNGRDGKRESPLIPEAYAAWVHHEPPHTLPSRIEPNPSLIQSQYDYRSFRNLTHLFSFALPWYAGSGGYGLLGATGWMEPLGKHMIGAGGLFSAAAPSESYGLFSYINNQFYPTLTLMAYRAPASARFYGRNFLVEEMTGGSLSASWPLDIFERAYRQSRIFARVRYADIHPMTLGTYHLSPALPDPEAGRLMDLRLSWRLKKQPPYYRNMLHPIEGFGFQVSVTGSRQASGTERYSFTTDAGAYTLLPLYNEHRLYLYARLQTQFGDTFPQHYIGFSRFDNIGFPDRSEIEDLQQSEADRVRGYTDFIAGRQVGFLSAEYRMPFLPSLNTSILGFLELGPTSLSLVADAGVVNEVTFSQSEETERDFRFGLGSEIKNLVKLGPLLFVHSVGIAQPAKRLFESEMDLYYRIQTSVPF